MKKEELKSVRESLENEITRLSGFWYNYVGQDHHKDRDCHWTIEKRWSYGNEPKYYVYHFGYIFDSEKAIECDTYEEAENELLGLLELAIGREKDWAKQVLKDDPKNWDAEQIKMAKMVDEFR